GLCRSCIHATVIRSDKGATFWMCTLAKSDPHFRKYPSLPVVRCPGFEGQASPGESETAT
ncbi:MAG: hypothetical protein LC118_11405, partial [Dehalococcoidia bacterium]|nr:hypothetical protein [Dehalococcoidia bacterium]